MPPAPLLCVCIKPAVRTDVHLRLDEAGHAPRADEVLLAANAADLAALQLALSLRGRHAELRVLALSVGAPAAEGVLREALAAGADEALRAWGGAWPDDAGTFDGSADSTQAHAVAAAELLRPRAPLLVLAGERSADRGNECFGAFLAAALGAAFAHRVTEVRREDAGWRVTARLERGYGQELALASPAVVTVSAQLPKPGHAALPAWLASREAAVPLVAVDAPPPPAVSTRLRVPVPRVKRTHAPQPGLSAEQRIQAMVTLEARGGGTVLGGEPPEAMADAMLRLLHERGYL